LFYNVPIRKKISSSGNDQFAKIFDIISKYAIHNHKISFTLKKFGENNSIKSQPSETPIDAIRIIFGNSVAKALIHVFVDNIGLKFKMIGYISKADFDAGKKSQLILFINHRLVESKSLKRALFGDIYKKILADSHPFIYMAIEIAPENVDVNVSPTKHEVHFLNEELIVESIKSVVEETLLQSNQTRVLYAQQLLPGAPKVSFETSKTEKDRLYAKDMIRTDPKEQSIVKFLKRDNDFDASISQIMPALKKPRMAPSSLDTISNLLAEAVDRADTGLMHQIRKLKFVGSASRRKSLIQCENLLYLVDNRRFAEELFYQALLKSFSNFNAIEFKKPLKIKDLVTIAKSLKAHKPEDSEIVDKTLERLMDIRELLGDYFKISINDEGELLSIPILVPNYAPLMAELPTFITRLGRSFDYEDEKASLQSICKELAQFYSKWSLRTSEKEHNRLMEDVIFHRIRLFLFPPKEFLSNGTILKLTSLQDLYKVFERC
jgi:DNA mismatch repair protein MLH1